MKNRKKKHCPKCGSTLRLDKTIPGYLYSCDMCDESMYKFEAVKSRRKKK